MTGLTPGSSLVLYNNHDRLLISANGNFIFPSRVPDGSSYEVTIGALPPGQMCSVSNGSGTSNDGKNVLDVAVSCTR